MSIKETDFRPAIHTQDWDALHDQFNSAPIDQVIACLATVLEDSRESPLAKERAWQVFSRLPLERCELEHRIALTHLVSHSTLFSVSDTQLLNWFATACIQAPNQALFMASNLCQLWNARDADIGSALLPAIGSGRREIIDTLLQKAPSLVNVEDRAGLSALHYAVRRGRWDLIAPLIQAGAALDRPSNLLQILSGISFQAENLPWILGLLRDFSQDNNSLENPCIGTLLLYGLIVSATPEDLPAQEVEELLNGVFSQMILLGDKVSDDDWAKLLTVAAKVHHIPFITMLQSHGILDRFKDVGAILCWSGDPQLIDWYLENFDLDDLTENPVSPMAYLWSQEIDTPEMMKRRLATIKRILEAGASPNGSDPNGIPILFLAAQSGTWREVQLLRSYGANLHQRDSQDGNVFHYANSNPETFFHLLDRGIDPLQFNQRQERPLSALKNPSLNPLPWVEKLVRCRPETLRELCKNSAFSNGAPDNELIWESPLVVSAMVCLPEGRQKVLDHLVDLIPSDPLDPVQQVTHFAWLAPLFERLFSAEELLALMENRSPLAFSELLRYASDEQRESLAPTFLKAANKLLAGINLAYLGLDIGALAQEPKREAFVDLRNKVLNLRRQVRPFLDHANLLGDSELVKRLQWTQDRLSHYFSHLLSLTPRLPMDKKEVSPSDVDIMQGLMRLFPDGKFAAADALGSRLTQVYNVGLSSLADLHVLGLATEDCLPDDLRREQQQLLRDYLDQEGLEEFWNKQDLDSLEALQKQSPSWEKADFFKLGEKRETVD